MPRRTISFGAFRLLPDQRQLLEDSRPVHIGARALDVLVCLAERAGEVVGNDELMARAWPARFVEEANLRQQISSLRKMLGAGPDGSGLIRNVVGRGYSFVAPVELGTDASDLDVPPQPRTHGVGLPELLTRPIGCETTIAALSRDLSLFRLVTIAGPGGIGKTTVAVAVAKGLYDQYEHGAHFVDLSPVADGDLVASSVGAAVGASLGPAEPPPRLVAHLREKHMLIVLDNCEHLVGDVAILCEALLRGAPRVRILATSREPLAAESETVRRLRSMDFPQTGKSLNARDAMAYPAVQLFVERAMAASDVFIFSDADVAMVTEVCRRLDGIPLAIELAASRVEQLGVKGLADRLDGHFGLAIKGRRTALPRHQTLRTTLDWSFQSLSPIEQTLLARLSIFRGAFTLEWADAVAQLGNDETCDNLADLVAKSLVVPDLDGETPRYRLIELVRAYGLEKLTASGEIESLAKRHAQQFLHILTTGELDLARPLGQRWLDPRYGVVNDVRQALDWSYSPGGDRRLGSELTAASGPLWMTMSLMREWRSRVETALSQLHDEREPFLSMQLHAALGAALLHTEGRGSEEVWNRVAELAMRLDDRDHLMRSFWGLWIGHFTSSDFRGALAAAERMVAVPPGKMLAADQLVGMRLLGVSQHILGHQAAARTNLETMLTRYAPPDDGSHRVRFQYDQRVAARTFLSQTLWVQGFPDQASRVSAVAVEEARSIGHTATLFYTLVHAACPVSLLRRDLLAADDLIRELLEAEMLHGPWAIWGACYRGVWLIEEGRSLEGVECLRDALAREAQVGSFQQRHDAFLGALATGLAACGQVDLAIETVSEALKTAERTGSLWCLPELLRIRGQLILLAGGGGSAARARGLFTAALRHARAQGARSWELRAATSLAALERDRGDPLDAMASLKALVDSFDEGAGAADQIEARALLAEFAGDGLSRGVSLQ